MGLPPFKKPARIRSRNMRAIRSVGNKSTDVLMASLFRSEKIRGWRRHLHDIPGRPDFVFLKQRVAIFVDGCFFHGHEGCGHVPRTNTAYWSAKIDSNKRRDRTVSRMLRKSGYNVVRIWECQLRKSPSRCIKRVLDRL